MTIPVPMRQDKKAAGLDRSGARKVLQKMLRDRISFQEGAATG